MRIIINGWDGDKFLNDNYCHLCGELSTTIELQLTGYYDTWLIACKSCLLNMVAEIDKKILESKS